jgi:hypothetical protein
MTIRESNGRTWLVLWLQLLAWTSSCSSSPTGGGASGGAATSAEIQSLCDAQCARSARCRPPATDPSDGSLPCVTSCIQDLGHLAENVRGDITRALTACYDALACGVNDDGCTTQAVAAIGQSPDAQIHSQDVQTCLRKQDACASTPGYFSDDLCGTMVMLIPTKRADIARCFDGPCELVPACIDPIVGG